MPAPSILIGFGAYGLRVMRSFLASAATRGALAWDDSVVVAALNERSLKSLSLFWVPDVLGSLQQHPAESLPSGDGYELMDDLFHQICMLDGTFTQIRTSLAEAVSVERTRLLDAGRHGERDMPQLDVFVIAQPTSQDMIGHIRNLMDPVMATLAADPSFQTAQANGLLNCIQIFDFEDYWSRDGEEVRMALRRMVEEGNQSSGDENSSAGLTYLFDGNTPAGKRTPGSRQQEVVLFLQFLLLEDIRSLPDARAFFEPSQLKASVCSFGIRVVERSSGSLRRLAAAAFAHGWLEHMESGEAYDSKNPAFQEVAGPWRTGSLDGIVGEKELRAATFAEIAAVEKAMTDHSRAQSEPREGLQVLATRLTEAAILRLSRRSAAQSEQLSRQRLKSFRDEIDRAVIAALQERSPVLTLGAVIDELQQLETEFVAAAFATNITGQMNLQSSSPFDQAADMQREYDLYLSRQIQTAALKRLWWPRSAIVFALAFSPVLMTALSTGPLSGFSPLWIPALGSAALLAFLFWQFGRTLFQSALSFAAERGREFYCDPDRGRLVERIRKAVHSPAVAGKISGYGNVLIDSLRKQAFGALADEFRYARLTLVERRDEIHWLRSQVRDFLRSNQVDDRSFPPVFQENRIPSDVRFSLERNEDLAQVAASLPRDPSRFREQVATRRLFALWSRSFCPTFLHPLQFLDELSASFTDRSEIDETDIRRRALQIKSFLENELHFSVCFKWLVTDGLPSVAKGMLLPTSWSGLDGVEPALRTAGFSQHRISTANPERLYIYQYQLGIPSTLLVRPSLATQGDSQ